MPADASTIERELRRIGEQVATPTTLVLFGGCSMTLQGFKAATRDVDGVLVQPHLFPAFLAAAAAAGFETAETPDLIVFDDYVAFNGAISLEVFPPHHIFAKPFTEAMAQRTLPGPEAGALNVRLADASTMFLFKSVTGRWLRADQVDLPVHERRDIEDLARFLDRGAVDWDFVESEWQATPAAEQAAMNARNAVDRLRGLGYYLPWNP